MAADKNKYIALALKGTYRHIWVRLQGDMRGRAHKGGRIVPYAHLASFGMEGRLHKSQL